jgi:hypothetical protein
MRALYFASNRFWRVNGRTEFFDHWIPASRVYENGADFGTRGIAA